MTANSVRGPVADSCSAPTFFQIIQTQTILRSYSGKTTSDLMTKFIPTIFTDCAAALIVSWALSCLSLLGQRLYQPRVLSVFLSPHFLPVLLLLLS